VSSKQSSSEQQEDAKLSMPTSSNEVKADNEAAESNQKSKEGKGKPLTRSEHLMLWFNGTLALTAIVGVVLVILQMCNAASSENTNQRNIATQLEIAKSQADSLAKLAAAAKTQAEGTRDLASQWKRSADAVQHAALTVDIISEPQVAIVPYPPNPSMVGQKWRAIAVVSLVTNATAKDVTLRALAEVVRDKRPRFGSEPTLITGASLLNLNDVRSSPFRFADSRTGRGIEAMTQELLNEVSGGVAQVWFHGNATYTDMVGCHVQDFCLVFDPTIKTGGTPSVPTGAFVRCQQHNDEHDCVK
jgi:hypothetical protein